MSTSQAPTFEWAENWSTIPASQSAQDNGRTHGICATAAGTIIVFHQAENGLLTLDPDGHVISAIGGDRWLGAHGLTLIKEGNEEFLWLVDQESREVVKVTLDGETVMSIDKPDHPIYDEKNYTPTWAAQNPNTGDIWVGDGYGSSLVHRYDKTGTYLTSIDGSDGAGQFREPHGLNFFNGADGEPELWITDRANHRIQVYNGDGAFLRSSKVCHSPCCFDERDGVIVIPELFTGVKLINAANFELVTEMGASDRVMPQEDINKWWPPQAPKGWPNLAGTEHVRPHYFNSPHGACFDTDGNVFVVEWIVGGRITKLSRQ